MAEAHADAEFKFEVLHKDLMGRVGRLRTPRGAVVETPTLMPVLNPGLASVGAGAIGAEEMRKHGAEMLITNAYLIYRKPDLREEAVKKGVHSLLGLGLDLGSGCETPVMTDSGSYQLYEYSDVEVSNREILDFQRRIGSDVCVPLDIPTAPFPHAKREQARADLEETLRRLREARETIWGGDKMLAGVVQGSSFLDLRAESARRAAEIGFDLYAIGGVVPLLASYRFEELVDVVVAAKRELPLNAPVHLFGAGHPMIFPLAVALGCDLFDSAAYALYAKAGRYLTSEGTRRVADLRFLPCSCPVCSSHSVGEVRESAELLASHNLCVSFAEMRTVKQSVAEGRLWELCERRCRAHPALLSGLRRLAKYSALLERFDPATKLHPFFYLGETSAHRPEVLRYSERLERFKLSGRVLVSTNPFSKEKCFTEKEEEKFESVFFVKPPFGPCPVELAETYPVGQAEVPAAAEADSEAKTVALRNVLKLLEMNVGKAKFVFVYDRSWACECRCQPLIEEIGKYAEVKMKK
ncbi:tRNA-guanine(15) transglycosylase [ANME-1 cluster archaeon ex4572_4]|nr:MAG: tRNA-guanine(15) transglycosylase [ANME-1 cluster archaeon ex4572_4]HDN68047.1 tRNA guanosine(15) transglycosylase TgtA [Methanomicrobia archaeon]